MPHGYNEVFTLEKLLDREEDYITEDILSEIREVRQDLNSLSSINDKLEEFKKCLLIICEKNEELKDNLSIVLKKNEEYELKLTEIKNNTTKKVESFLSFAVKWIKTFIIIFFIKDFARTITSAYGISVSNLWRLIKKLKNKEEKK